MRITVVLDHGDERIYRRWLLFRRRVDPQIPPDMDPRDYVRELVKDFLGERITAMRSEMEALGIRHEADIEGAVRRLIFGPENWTGGQ